MNILADEGLCSGTMSLDDNRGRNIQRRLWRSRVWLLFLLLLLLLIATIQSRVTNAGEIVKKVEFRRLGWQRDSLPGSKETTTILNPSVYPFKAVEGPVQSPMTSYLMTSLKPDLHQRYMATSPSTPAPVATPSQSLIPSETPSATPNPSVSTMPSTPSVMPTISVFPTSAPTLECHDEASYRSPINNLTCQDHAGTECIQWRFIGLNVTQLEDLIENCPASCKIPCGSFSQISTSLSFVLSGVPGLLDVTTQVPLEEATMEYVPEFVEMQVPGATLVLTHVELLSQDLVGPKRTLEAPTIQLDVVLSLIGFSIALDDSQLTPLLVAVVDSPGYTSAVRSSGPFYTNAQVSSTLPEEPSIPTTDEERDSSPSSALISSLVIVSVVIFACGAGAFCIYRRKRAKRRPSPPPLGQGKDYPSVLGTPNYVSRPGSLFSFDLSPGDSDSATPVQTNNIAGLNGTLSRSRDSTSQSTSAQQSPLSEEDQISSDDGEHPLANIIPPMIVIDHIDEEDNAVVASVDGENRVSSGIPIRHMEASTEFAEAISTSNQPKTLTTFAGLLYSCNSFGEPRQDVIADSVNSDHDRDDDESAASSPVKGTEMYFDVPLRKTVSSEVYPSIFTDAQRKSQRVQYGRTKRKQEVHAFGLPRDADNTTRGDERQLKYLESEPRISSSTDAHSISHISEKSVTSDRPLTPSRSSFGDARISGRTSPGSRYGQAYNRESGKLTGMFPKRSPIHNSSPRSDHWRLSLPMPELAEVSLETDDLPRSVPNHASGRSHSLGSTHEQTSSNEELKRSFDAPCKSKLGLLIESSRGKGSKIHTVKDYSPLFGLVNAGDKIVEIDGVSTVQMDTADVMKVLARKKGGVGSFRITVARPVEKSEATTHSFRRNFGRSSSWGSTDESSHRTLDPPDIVTDADQGAEVMIYSPDSSGEHTFHHLLGVSSSEGDD